MLPSRCLRCGAVSREPLCPSCVDFLVAYRPFWLNPALLPGPSLLDLLGPREIALLSAEGREIEWRAPRREPTRADAVRLVRLLALDETADAVVSAGDADILHAFLGEAKKALPSDPEERAALVSLCGYLSTREWMPPHLAQEYRLRARALAVPSERAEEVPAVVTRVPEPSAEETIPEAASEGGPAIAPEPTPGPPAEAEVPAPSPEPTPEPEAGAAEPAREEPPAPAEGAPSSPEAPSPSEASMEDAAQGREEFDRERQEMEAWVRERSEEIETKERSLADRELALEAKVEKVEEAERLVTERLIALEKDEARREVLRFLARVPGMTEEQAAVISTAFPDMEALEAADAKALAQCQGVTEALARAVRYELVPGEVEDEERTIRLREEAHAFLEEGNYEGALDCYTRLLEERPEEKALWFDRAEVLVLLGRTEEALQCYQRVIDLDRRSRQAWFERANLLFGMGRVADAVDSLKEALQIDPRRSQDILGKAEQLRRDGHPNEAAILFQSVLDVDPGNGRAVLGLGDCFIDLGDMDAAEGLFTRALGSDGGHPEILFRKAEILNQKGRWGAAIQFHNRAIALRWDYLEAWLAKGLILLDHERPQEALDCFEKVLSFDPGNETAAQGRTRARGLLGGTVRAEPPPAPEPSEEAAEEPADRSGVAAFADAFREAMEEEPAPSEGREEIPADFKSFVDSVEPEKEDTQVLVQLAELALEGGDPQMALLRFEQAIAQDPRSSDAWRGKGTALQQLERFEDALEAYDRALELDPADDLAKRWRETCLRHLDREGSL